MIVDRYWSNVKFSWPLYLTYTSWTWVCHELWFEHVGKCLTCVASWVVWVCCFVLMLPKGWTHDIHIVWGEILRWNSQRKQKTFVWTKTHDLNRFLVKMWCKWSRPLIVYQITIAISVRSYLTISYGPRVWLRQGGRLSGKFILTFKRWVRFQPPRQPWRPCEDKVNVIASEHASPFMQAHSWRASFTTSCASLFPPSDCAIYPVSVHFLIQETRGKHFIHVFVLGWTIILEMFWCEINWLYITGFLQTCCTRFGFSLAENATIQDYYAVRTTLILKLLWN